VSLPNVSNISNTYPFLKDKDTQILQKSSNNIIMVRPYDQTALPLHGDSLRAQLAHYLFCGLRAFYYERREEGFVLSDYLVGMWELPVVVYHEWAVVWLVPAIQLEWVALQRDAFEAGMIRAARLYRELVVADCKRSILV
jgi:hypothetical protein